MKHILKLNINFNFILALTMTLSFCSTANAENITVRKDHTYLTSLNDYESKRIITSSYVRYHIVNDILSNIANNEALISFNFSKDEISSLIASKVMINIVNEKNNDKSYYILAETNIDSFDLIKYIESLRGKKQLLRDWEAVWIQVSSALTKLTSNSIDSPVEVKKLINFLTVADSFYRGYSLLQNHDYITSIEAFNKVIAQDPDNILAYFGRGYAYKQLNYQDKSLRDFDKVVELEPTLSKAYVIRGDILLNIHRYEEATASYGRAIQLDPKSASAYNGRGFILFFEGNNKIQGLQDLEKAVELDPTYKNVVNAGLAYMELGKFPQAILAMNKIVELMPEYEFSYIQRGRVYDRAKQYEQALQDFDKAVEMNPNNDKGYKFLVLTFAKMGGIQQDTLTKAKNTSPISNQDHLARGLAWLYSGNYQVALSEFNIVCKNDPENIEAYLYRASTHGGLQDQAKKMADLQSAARLGSKYAQDFLKFRNIIW